MRGSIITRQLERARASEQRVDGVPAGNSSPSWPPTAHTSPSVLVNLISMREKPEVEVAGAKNVRFLCG